VRPNSAACAAAAHTNGRSEGPVGNGPGRQPGVYWKLMSSPEAAAQSIGMNKFAVSPFQGFPLSYPYPGLTLRATFFRPFGPAAQIPLPFLRG